jgi:hypothetical protein
VQQSPFGTPAGFDPPDDDAQQWSQRPAPAPVRAPGEEVWSGIDITPQGAPPRRKRGRAVVAVVGTTVLVSGLAVGGTFAMNALGGGGERAEQHLPGNTLAMAELDLDPSLGQKVDAVRFLSRLPEARDKVNADSDLREVLYEALTEDVKGAPAWDQAQEWLGDRVAVAALPGSEAKHPVESVLVIQVRDDQGAQAGLAKAAGKDNSVTVRNGWAFVARTKEIADRVASTNENASLAADATFQADLDELGETGIATGWVDAKKVASVVESYAKDSDRLGGMLGQDLGGLQELQKSLSSVRGQLGHGAAAIRFDGPQLEFAMAMTGGKAGPEGGPSGIGDLPADSMFALSATGLGDAVKTAWPKGKDSGLGGLGQGLGIKLPDDLAALLGTRTQVAVGKFDGFATPVVGIRATTSDPRVPNALAALKRITEGGGLFQLQQQIAGGYVMSTDAAQLKALAGGNGGLGAKPGFSSVLPDAATAQTAAYFDLAAYADVMKSLGDSGDADSAEDTKLLKELGAAGLTVRTDQDGNSRVSVRIGVK